MIAKYIHKYQRNVIKIMRGYPDMFDEFDLESIGENDLKRFVRNHIRLVFVEDDVIKGFVCAKKELDSTYWKILWLVVGKEFAGQGIGSKLLRELEAALVSKKVFKVFLDTSNAKNATSVSTLAFYEKNGFKRAGELPDFYGKGDSELIFYKFLK